MADQNLTDNQKPPRTIKQLLKAILEVLLCMDASIHRIEALLAESSQDEG